MESRPPARYDRLIHPRLIQPWESADGDRVAAGHGVLVLSKARRGAAGVPAVQRDPGLHDALAPRGIPAAPSAYQYRAVRGAGLELRLRGRHLGISDRRLRRSL